MHQRDAEAVLLLADSLLGAGQPAAAATVLRGLAASGTADIRVTRLLVAALLEAGSYVEAEPAARELATQATGGDLAPALFFHAHALWGCGRTEECRRVVDRFAAALASDADGGKETTG
ncbi:MAG: hypothetical protein LIP77_10375 [Planctomycetes bacterium]|nr:hypothetical protein [Planctomycetota bacterium]